MPDPTPPASTEAQMTDNICTMIEDKDVPGQYRVEGFTEDGGCEIAIFCGPNAIDRAIAYAASDCYYTGWNDPQDWSSQATPLNPHVRP